MINTIETYYESGRQAGIAANHQDWWRVQFERDWLARAIALEDKACAATARNTWALAYSQARKV
jgi:hypothetical protein